MENEKKKDSSREESQHHKKNHSRRKGYFIDPAAKENEKAKRPNETVTSSKINGAAPEKKQNGNGQKNFGHSVLQTQKDTNASNAIEKSNSNKRRRNRHKPKDTSASNRSATEPSSSPGMQPKQEKSQDKTASKSRQDSKNRKKQNDRRQDFLIDKGFSKAIPFSDDEYEEVCLPVEETPTPLKKEKKEEADAPMIEVVGIRFKSTGKVYYFAPAGKVVKKGDFAIVETARGQEYGEVAMGNSLVRETDIVPPLRPIIRVATEADRTHQQENKAKEEDAFRVCNERILSHGLDMKLVDAQYTFDNTKLLFYFTSAGRVDFRDLVKDLASVFRTRIELRQIGIRDEAKLMGGMGMCGRSLCCTRFLSDFGQVSIKMAKEQNLSLNSAKISGICGRLMCCLRYEHETYEYEIKRTPPVDSIVRTADGNGIVTEMNPLAGTIKVRLLSSPETPPKLYHRDDVIRLQKKKPQPKGEQ